MVKPKNCAATLLARYVRTAEDTLRRCHADALINGLTFDRHFEELAVAAFSKGIDLARRAFLEDPLGVPLIPNWNRVVAALPDFLTRLNDAAEQDNSTRIPELFSGWQRALSSYGMTTK